MSERTYILAIDPICSLKDFEKLQNFVTTSKDIGSWWNHIPMLFMLESQLAAEALADKLHLLAPDAKFLLTEVDLAAAQGWLPEISWKWIEKRALAATPRQDMRV